MKIPVSVVASGNTPNALGLALHFMQRYYPESDFATILLQMQYRVNTGYNGLGINQVDFSNPQVERRICQLLTAVAPNAELLEGVEGERNPQSRIKELERSEQKRLPTTIPSYSNH